MKTCNTKQEIKIFGRKRVGYVLWASFCILLGIFMIVFGFVGYESNDDIYLATIPSGFYGKYYPYTIHNNVLLGLLISIFSKFLPLWNWTTAIYLFIILFSYLTFGIWCIGTKGQRNGFFINLLLVFATASSMLHRMNYTKTGALALFVGLVVLFSTIEEPMEKNIRNLACGTSIFLIFFGSLVRYKTTLAVFPFFTIYLMYYFFKGYRKNWKKMIPLGVVFLLVFFCWGINFVIYQSDQQWRDFREYNTVREKVMDYGLPPWEDYREDYEKLGFSENDYYSFQNWRFADDTVFGIENLKSILAIKEKSGGNRLTWGKIQGIMKEMVILPAEYPILYLIFLLFGYSLFRSSAIKKIVIILIFTLGMMEIGYLLYEGRCIERAVMIPIMGVFVSLIYFSDWKGKKESFFMGLVCLCSYFLFMITDWKEIERYETPIKENVNGVFSELSTNSNKLFVWDTFVSSTSLVWGYTPMDPFPLNGHSNSVFIGGWLVPSPIMGDISSPFGERANVYKLLAENENVFFVTMGDVGVAMVEQYIREHYASNAMGTLVEVVDGYSIYSFSNYY